MDRRVELAQRQREWIPPDGLDRTRPRLVRLTAGGRALVILAGAFAVAAFAAGIFLYAKSTRQAEEQRVLREAGVETEATVIRHWREQGESRQPMIAYRFAVAGRNYDASVKTPMREWKNLDLGSLVTVRYSAANPAISHPRDWTGKVLPPWLSYLVAAILALNAVLVLTPVRRQRRMLSDGRAALGLVTGHSAIKRGTHGHNLGKQAYYEFLVLSGALAQGKTEPNKKPPAVGSIVCVLYDPENPRRCALYPLRLVRPFYTVPVTRAYQAGLARLKRTA